MNIREAVEKLFEYEEMGNRRFSKERPPLKSLKKLQRTLTKSFMPGMKNS